MTCVYQGSRHLDCNFKGKEIYVKSKIWKDYEDYSNRRFMINNYFLNVSLFILKIYLIEIMIF
jgi:hypothetical protein